MTLYITDLDGTLLNAESQISAYSKAKLNELARAGAMITFATARTPATITGIFEGVKLNVPGIVMTGAAIYDLNSNVYSEARFLEPKDVEASLKIFAQYGVNPFVYVLGYDNRLHAYHTNEMSRAEEDFYSIRRDTRYKQFHIGENVPDALQNRVLLIFAVGRAIDLMEVEKAVTESIGYAATFYNDIFVPDSGYMEVFARGVSKAVAMRSLAQRIGADTIVAFGDNLNDTPMLKAATCGVAVENAYPEVKEAADLVIGPNSSDSVVDYIYNDFFNAGA